MVDKRTTLARASRPRACVLERDMQLGVAGGVAYLSMNLELPMVYECEPLPLSVPCSAFERYGILQIEPLFRLRTTVNCWDLRSSGRIQRYLCMEYT